MSALLQAADILYPQFKERMPGIIPTGIDQDPHIRLTRDIVSRTKDMKFFPPSSLYHKYMPALDGSMKMSKSNPDSFIELPEDPKSACKKISRAKTGGRDTIEEQRKHGGQPEKCMVFELYKQHLIEDDKELEKIHQECKSGKMLCGECKKIACEKITKFMDDLEKNINLAKKNIDKVRFVKFEHQK
jgi:tryptophanyl-tRNA synthetase